MGQAENAVMYAVEQVCGLYGVQVTREQSRVLRVRDDRRATWRPMYFGTWVDDKGVKHTGGRADFLARPRIDLTQKLLAHERIDINMRYRSVPLWIETKAKGAKTNKKTRYDQECFRQWVESNGDYYLTLIEDMRPLLVWFEEHGVTKNASAEELAAVVSPMDASELNMLPCRWCGFEKSRHVGTMFSCPLHLCANDTRLIGKVWSPKLVKRAK